MTKPGKPTQHARHRRVRTEIFQALCLALYSVKGRRPMLKDLLFYSKNSSLSSFYCHFRNLGEAITELLAECQEELKSRLCQVKKQYQAQSVPVGQNQTQILSTNPVNSAEFDLQIWHSVFKFLWDHQNVLLAFEAQADRCFLDLVARATFPFLSVSALRNQFQRKQAELLFIGLFSGIVRIWIKQGQCDLNFLQIHAKLGQKLTKILKTGLLTGGVSSYHPHNGTPIRPTGAMSLSKAGVISFCNPADSPAETKVTPKNSEKT